MTQNDWQADSRSRDPLTYDLIGAAMDAHRYLGPGLPERVHQEALGNELRRRGIPFETEVELQIDYRGAPLRNHFRVDVVAADSVIVELKALEGLSYLERIQLLTYLRVGPIKKGLLLNFGAPRLEYERFVG